MHSSPRAGPTLVPFRPRPTQGSVSPFTVPPLPYPPPKSAPPQRPCPSLLALRPKPRPSRIHFSQLRPASYSPASQGPAPRSSRVPSPGGAAVGPRAFCVGIGPRRALSLQRPRVRDARARTPQQAEGLALSLGRRAERVLPPLRQRTRGSPP